MQEFLRGGGLTAQLHSLAAEGKLVAEMVDADLAELEKQRLSPGSVGQAAPEELTKVMSEVTKKTRLRLRRRRGEWPCSALSK